VVSKPEAARLTERSPQAESPVRHLPLVDLLIDTKTGLSANSARTAACW
jgi:hypothetical protein